MTAPLTILAVKWNKEFLQKSFGFGFSISPTSANLFWAWWIQRFFDTPNTFPRIQSLRDQIESNRVRI